jgi:hypothetical protein
MPSRVKQLLSVLGTSIVFLIALSSCGKIGDPVPPGLIIPQPITDRRPALEKKNDCSNYCSDESNTIEKNLQEKD